jgi:hypothetical protein
MAKPWEKFKADQPKKESSAGPWQKFASGQPTSLMPSVSQSGASADSLLELIKPLYAAGLGAADTATFGGSTSILDLLKSGKAEEIMKESPVSTTVGRIGGALPKYSPFGAAMNLTAKGISRGSQIIPDLLSKSPVMNLPLRIVGGGAKVAAEVPTTAATQTAIDESVRSLMRGELPSPLKIKERASAAALDPLSLAVAAPISAVSEVGRQAKIPQALYTASPAINAKDAQRAYEQGRDLPAEMMDAGITGFTKEQMINKARGVKEKAFQGREKLIDEAEATGKQSPSRGPILDALKKRMNEILGVEGLDRSLKESQVDPYMDAWSQLASKPSQMSPRELETMLRNQKGYLRQRKTDNALGGLYAGDPQAAKIEPMRTMISAGLKEQGDSLASILSPKSADKFRDLGKQYGAGSMAERSIIGEIGKDPSIYRAISPSMSVLAKTLRDSSGGNYQKILTLLRQISEEGK